MSIYSICSDPVSDNSIDRVLESLSQMLEYSVKLIKLLYTLSVNEKLPVNPIHLT